MSRPFLLAQLSDPHIGADWFDDQAVPRFAAAVEAVRGLRPQPDAVLLTGDLADHATDEEYELVRELLAPLSVPMYVLAGNHDDCSPSRLWAARSGRRAAAVLGLDFTLEEIELYAEPAGFAVHAVVDGDLTSHVQPVR